MEFESLPDFEPTPGALGRRARPSARTPDHFDQPGEPKVTGHEDQQGERGHGVHGQCCARRVQSRPDGKRFKRFSVSSFSIR